MQGVARALAALLIGGMGGFVFLTLHIPLPWVLGSFCATALCSQLGLRLGLPRQARGLAMVIVGTMLGAGFDENVLSHLRSWLPSLAMMLVLTAVFFVTSYAILRRFSDMSRTTAFLSAVPGGLTVVSAIAEDMGGDVRRIALSHTNRLVVLLLLTPILIGFISEYDLAQGSVLPFAQSAPLDLRGLGILLLCAALGGGLAKALKFNSGLLMFPLIFCAAVHITGLSDAHMPPAFAVLAQVVIGAGIGMRFQGYRLRDILRDSWLSCAIGVSLTLMSFAAAWLASRLTGLSAPALLLAFLPGGAPELGVVALTLGIEPALVATHSMIRVLALVLAMASFKGGKAS